MTQHFHKLFYRWGYTATTFALLDTISRAVPRPVANAIARLVASGYTATHPDVVETVRQNLLLLDPQADSSQARAVFRNFAVGLSDYWICGHEAVAKTAAWCRQRSGWEHLQAALERGRGAVLATGHFGLFEFGSLLLAEKGLPATVLTLSERTASLTRWRADFRRRWGAETIEIGREAFSSLRVVEALQANRFCALLVDRPFDGPSLDCPAPGGQVPFSLSAALLAYLADCPIIPVSIRRLPDASYALRAHAPIHPQRSRDREAVLRDMTRKMASVLLEDFSACPEQWYQFCPIRQ